MKDEEASAPRSAESAETLSARIAELEANQAALETELERLHRELENARSEAVEGRVARARLEEAVRDSEEARAEADRSRRALELAREEGPLRKLVTAHAERLSAASEQIATSPAESWRIHWPKAPGTLLPVSERTSRRMRKLRRDPKKFLEDSKNPMARRLARLLFP